MTDPHCTTVRISDSGVTVRSYDRNGEQIEEDKVGISTVLEKIESQNPEDDIYLQHGPDPE